MSTYFATSPIKLIAEVDLLGQDRIEYCILKARAVSDDQIVDACKTAARMGITVVNKPYWVDRALLACA